jgi:two-component system sensor histidine kinase TctE
VNSLNRGGSLQRLLVRRLLWPLIPILLFCITLSYALAKHAAVTAYDAGILDDARDLVKQVNIRDGHVALELPLAAAQMLAYNNEDAVVYAMWDANDALVTGDEQLYRAITKHIREKFRDIKLSGKLYRSVTITETKEDKQFTIAVAQAVKARSDLMREIFISMLILGGVLLIVSVTVVINAVRIGLQPVERLRDAIAQRNQNDLRPIAESDTPLELLPIIRGANELLEKLSASLGAYRRFVADAAHQLRTPLAALGSQLELSLVSPPDDTAALLKQLLDTTRRTSHLASQLLSLARLEHTEKTAIERREFDFKQLLQEAASSFVTCAARKSVEFEFSIEVDRFRGIELLLRELIGNLLDNAVRYAPPHSVIQVSLKRLGTFVQLQVIDAGPGVPAGELSKLGTPFHQLPSNAPQGCGLGLAIVREIAHLHGGEIIFANGAGGVGLVVTVMLAQPE